jgi:hypothetical protein
MATKTSKITLSTGARGPRGLPGEGAELTSYETQVESLLDYPTTFPPDLTGVTPSDIGAAESLDHTAAIFVATVGGGADTITDFSAASGDRIVLRAAAFGPEVRRLRQGWTLVSAVAPRAREPKPTILHDPGSGLIAFDRDGSGIRSPRVVAMVPRGTPVGPTMFEVR